MDLIPVVCHLKAVPVNLEREENMVDRTCARRLIAGMVIVR